MASYTHVNMVCNCTYAWLFCTANTSYARSNILLNILHFEVRGQDGELNARKCCVRLRLHVTASNGWWCLMETAFKYTATLCTSFQEFALSRKGSKLSRSIFAAMSMSLTWIVLPSPFLFNPSNDFIKFQGNYRIELTEVCCTTEKNKNALFTMEDFGAHLLRVLSELRKQIEVK